MSVVTVEETAKDVLVMHSSADSVSQFSGSASGVGTLSGPTVMVGQLGRGPMVLISIERDGGNVIGGGGPGGRITTGRLNNQPVTSRSSQLIQMLKNQVLQGMTLPSSVPVGSGTGVVMGIIPPATSVEVVLDDGGEVIVGEVGVPGSVVTSVAELSGLSVVIEVSVVDGEASVEDGTTEPSEFVDVVRDDDEDTESLDTIEEEESSEGVVVDEITL